MKNLFVFDKLEPPAWFLNPLSGYIALKKLAVEFEERSGVIHLKQKGVLKVDIDDKSGLIDNRVLEIPAGYYDRESFNKALDLKLITLNSTNDSMTIAEGLQVEFNSELVKALGLKKNKYTSKVIGSTIDISIARVTPPKCIIFGCSSIDEGCDFLNGVNTSILAKTSYLKSVTIEPVHLFFNKLKNDYRHELDFYMVDENNEPIKNIVKIKSILIEILNMR